MNQIRPLLCSDDVIEALTEALCSTKGAEHDKSICRESLRGLVRLAQAEQLLRMQLDFNGLTTGPPIWQAVDR